MALRDLDKAFAPDALRPPIVLNSERRWALGQCPSWLPKDHGIELFDDDLKFHEIVDDGDWLDCPHPPPPPDISWEKTVDRQIERFERHYAGLEKTYFEWAQLWRFWWSRVNLRKLYPSLAPKAPLQPFFRVGSAEFQRALEIGTADEGKTWRKFGIVQCRPDEPRLTYMVGGTRDDVRQQLLSYAEARLPDGVICLTSALFFHDLISACESEIWMWSGDLPDTFIYGVALHQSNAKSFKSGHEQHRIEGTSRRFVRVTTPVQSVVDCFSWHKRFGLKTAEAAMQRGLKRKLFSSEQLVKAVGQREVAAPLVREALEKLKV